MSSFGVKIQYVPNRVKISKNHDGGAPYVQLDRVIKRMCREKFETRAGAQVMVDMINRGALLSGINAIPKTQSACLVELVRS